jgi:hypothetical protein
MTRRTKQLFTNLIALTFWLTALEKGRVTNGLSDAIAIDQTGWRDITVHTQIAIGLVAIAQIRSGVGISPYFRTGRRNKKA